MNLQKCESGIGMAERPSVKKAPRVVLGLGHSGYAIAAATQLRAAGYDVTLTASNEEARRAAIRARASVVIVRVAALEPAQLLDAAKLMTAMPKKARVILVGPVGHPGLERMTAGRVCESEGVAALLRAVLA